LGRGETIEGDCWCLEEIPTSLSDQVFATLENMGSDVAGKKSTVREWEKVSKTPLIALSGEGPTSPTKQKGIECTTRKGVKKGGSFSK